MISVTLSFDGFRNATSLELAGNKTFSYRLEVSLSPFSHTDLVISFAFEWYVYMILYIGIGIISIFVMLFALGYHYTFSRIRSKVAFKFRSYFKVTLPSAFFGVLLGLVPSVIILSLISTIMTGKIFIFSLYSCGVEETNCIVSPFDHYRLSLPGHDDTNSKEFSSFASWKSRSCLHSHWFFT